MDRSLRRLGQLLVVMGAVLGAVLGVSLALIVEHAENSKAVAGFGRERAAVLAATSPSTTPSSLPGDQSPGSGAWHRCLQRPARRSQPAVPTSVMARPTRGSRIAGTSPTTAGTANPARERTRVGGSVTPRRTVPVIGSSRTRSCAALSRSASPSNGLPPPLFGGGPACPWPGLLPASGGGSPPCPRLWPLDGGCCLLPIAARAVRPGVPTLAGDVVGVTSRFDRSSGRHRVQLGPVRAAVGLGGSARVIVDRPRSRGRSGPPTGVAPWPSLPAPTAAPSPVLETGCRPGAVAGIGAVSSTVAKIAGQCHGWEPEASRWPRRRCQWSTGQLRRPRPAARPADADPACRSPEEWPTGPGHGP